MSEDLWEFLERCTPEGKWFLKALQHFNDKVMDRAEMRINKYDDGITVSTYKSVLHLTIKGDTLFFSFKRKKVRETTIIGRWYLHIDHKRAKDIIAEFLASIESIPLSLGDILEVARRIDEIIRKEREELLGKKVVESEKESD